MIIPTSQEIALAVSLIPDYSPISELAKSACITGDGLDPYDTRMVSSVQLSGWQCKIFSAQIAALMAVCDG
jgi:hypothetical protein